MKLDISMILVLLCVAVAGLFAQTGSTSPVIPNTATIGSGGTAYAYLTITPGDDKQDYDAKASWKFTIDGKTIELTGAQVASLVKSANYLNLMKMQNTNLIIQNGELTSRVEGLQKELDSLHTQLSGIHINALVSDVCPPAGIEPKDCAIQPDGSVKKITPPTPPPTMPSVMPVPAK